MRPYWKKVAILHDFIYKVVLIHINFIGSLYLLLIFDDISEDLPEMHLANYLYQFFVCHNGSLMESEVVINDEIN